MADSMAEHVANWKAEHPSYHEGKEIKVPPKPQS